jgi:hypothetical protein
MPFRTVIVSGGNRRRIYCVMTGARFPMAFIRIPLREVVDHPASAYFA